MTTLKNENEINLSSNILESRNTAEDGESITLEVSLTTTISQPSEKVITVSPE